MIFNFLKTSYTKVKDALQKTRSFFGQRLKNLFNTKIDEKSLEKLEEILYEADLGTKLAMRLTEDVRAAMRKDPESSSDELIAVLKAKVLNILTTPAKNVGKKPQSPPQIVMIVGVNGNGKTTSCARLAKKLVDTQQKVLLGAADTFRAAAIDQLDLWAKKANVDIVKGKPGSDPAAVAFDAATAAVARGIDVAIIDTAGRLHTKTFLMQELEKIKRSLSKVVNGAPHETYLVLDATCGQNAVDQAKTFSSFTPITGLILTKIDGTAKGGIIVNVFEELSVPIKFIGTGEGIDDLQPFDPQEFVNALFE